MKVLTPTDARKDFFKIPASIQESWEAVKIAYKSWSMVMIGEDDYNNLLENLHVMKDSVVMNQLQNSQDLEFQSFNSITELDDAI